MPRFYTAATDAVTTATASGDIDFIEIVPADDKPAYLCGMMISQGSDTGDTAEELLRLTVIRLEATVTSGSGGSTVTPRLVSNSGAAFGGTVEMDNTTVATSSGSELLLAAYQFNIRTGLELFLPPEWWFETAGGTAIVVRLEAAVTDELTMSKTFFLAEGG